MQALDRLIAGLKGTPGLLFDAAAVGTVTLTDADRLRGREVLEHIKGMLATDDPEAASLWESHASLLRALLANAGQVETAIAGFDYEDALQLLAANEETT
jgi:hypothetical protein